ncbi:MAG: hypothetical protein ACKVH8_25025, partial [Pirellulales bacterium]
GSADQINIINGNFTLGSNQSLNNIETIKLSQSNTAQDITIKGETSGIEVFEGTVNSSSVEDDGVIFSGSRDFSNITLKN